MKVFAILRNILGSKPQQRPRVIPYVFHSTMPEAAMEWDDKTVSRLTENLEPHEKLAFNELCNVMLRYARRDSANH